jgi:hypothetical protein
MEIRFMNHCQFAANLPSLDITGGRTIGRSAISIARPNDPFEKMNELMIDKIPHRWQTDLTKVRPIDHRSKASVRPSLYSDAMPYS